jgi:hypothetical protein
MGCASRFDLWLLLIRPEAAWDAKIAFVLGLIGVYTFSFGLLSATDVLKRMPASSTRWARSRSNWRARG